MDRVSFYSIIIVAMVLFLPLIARILRERPRVLKWSNYVILGIYVFANLFLTILSRTPKYNYDYVYTPFWSYKLALSSVEAREEVILNIILYIPFGYLVYHTFRKFNWWMILLSGFALSLITESIQLITRLGLCEIDDLISNTLGTFIGICMYQLYIKFVRDYVSAWRLKNFH